MYPNYGDIGGSWAQQLSYVGNQFIELEFSEESYILEIHIYETYNPGGVISIELNNSSGYWILVYGPVAAENILNGSRIFSPTIKQVDFKTKLVR